MRPQPTWNDVDNAEERGYRAGLERAAQWLTHDHELGNVCSADYYAAQIRALLGATGGTGVGAPALNENVGPNLKSDAAHASERSGSMQDQPEQQRSESHHNGASSTFEASATAARSDQPASETPLTDDLTKDERHHTVAETRYWCDQYKQHARSLERALAKCEAALRQCAGSKVGIYVSPIVALAAIAELKEGK